MAGDHAWLTLLKDGNDEPKQSEPRAPAPLPADKKGKGRLVEPSEEPEAGAMDDDAPLETSSHLYSIDELLKDPIRFVPSKEPDTSAEIKYTPCNVPSNSPARASVLAAPAHAPVASSSAVPYGPTPPVSPSKQKPLSLRWTKEIRRAAPGLTNYGNTCFLNASLQALLHTPPLVIALMRGDHHPNDCDGKQWCPLCKVVALVMKAYGNPRQGPFHPDDFVGNNIRRFAKHLSPGRQEDSHEFLRFCMDAMMTSELVGLNAREADEQRDRTIVQRIFGGRFRSRVECLTCRHPSDTYDYFHDLSLDIRNATNIAQAIKAFRQADQLRGKNQYKCERCKTNVDANKTVLVDVAPPVLTLHLKRFATSGRKITDMIGYEKILNLKPIMADPNAESRYRLYAMVCHAGGGPHSGHYTAYVEAADGFWYNADDSTMSRQGPNPPLNVKQAYMLFYIRDTDSLLDAVAKATSSPHSLSNGVAKRKAEEQISPEANKRLPSDPHVPMPPPRDLSTLPKIAKEPLGPQRPPNGLPAYSASEDIGEPVPRPTAPSSGGASANTKDFYSSTSGPTSGNRKLGNSQLSSSSPAASRGQAGRQQGGQGSSLFIPRGLSYRGPGMTKKMQKRNP